MMVLKSLKGKTHELKPINYILWKLIKYLTKINTHAWFNNKINCLELIFLCGNQMRHNYNFRIEHNAAFQENLNRTKCNQCRFHITILQIHQIPSNYVSMPDSLSSIIHWINFYYLCMTVFIFNLVLLWYPLMPPSGIPNTLCDRISYLSKKKKALNVCRTN